MLRRKSLKWRKRPDMATSETPRSGKVPRTLRLVRIAVFAALSVVGFHGW